MKFMGKSHTLTLSMHSGDVVFAHRLIEINI